MKWGLWVRRFRPRSSMYWWTNMTLIKSRLPEPWNSQWNKPGLWVKSIIRRTLSFKHQYQTTVVFRAINRSRRDLLVRIDNPNEAVEPKTCHSKHFIIKVKNTAQNEILILIKITANNFWNKLWVSISRISSMIRA